MTGGLLFIVAAVLATHPAGNPNARLLTVEESVGQSVRSVYPERVKLFWTKDGKLTKEPQKEDKTYTLPKSEGPGIVYGQTVSRNEFGFTSGVFPSPDGSRLAVYRKDESAVGLFPLFDVSSARSVTRWPAPPPKSSRCAFATSMAMSRAH